MTLPFRLTLITSLALCHITTTAQPTSLHNDIQKITQDKQATVGVSICPIGSTDTININGITRLPMLSVFKFHLALAVLDQVDKNKISLNQKIKVTPSDLLPNTWSPIRDKHPKGASITVSELLKYTVSQSDNNGCDILLRLIGGTNTVEQYLRRTGANNVEIKVNEEQMHLDTKNIRLNWTTPQAAVWLLSKFYAGGAVSPKSQEFLSNIMAKTTTGTMRLKGLLPTETVVIHKTGSSDTDAQGITAATNDIGIIILPDKSAYAIAIMVCDSQEDNATNEKIIAQISHAVWQHLNHQLK